MTGYIPRSSATTSDYSVKIKKSQLNEYPAALLRLGFFIIKDKTGRSIRLTDERWKHLSRHLQIQQNVEQIKETLQNPDQITGYSYDPNVKYYYKYYKHRASKAKHLRIIVKYLNGDGFIVTAHFIDKIK